MFITPVVNFVRYSDTFIQKYRNMASYHLYNILMKYLIVQQLQYIKLSFYNIAIDTP
jgi:hypothetical protein